MSDLISRQAAIEVITKISYISGTGVKTPVIAKCNAVMAIEGLPSAQPEYKPVTAEDFAKTMSENTLYGFMAWHGEALTLMKGMGFVICKKTM